MHIVSSERKIMAIKNNKKIKKPTRPDNKFNCFLLIFLLPKFPIRPTNIHIHSLHLNCLCIQAFLRICMRQVLSMSSSPLDWLAEVERPLSSRPSRAVSSSRSLTGSPHSFYFWTVGGSGLVTAKPVLRIRDVYLGSPI